MFIIFRRRLKFQPWETVFEKAMCAKQNKIITLHT